MVGGRIIMMKKIILIILLLFINNNVFAKDNEVKVSLFEATDEMAVWCTVTKMCTEKLLLLSMKNI